MQGWTAAAPGMRESDGPGDFANGKEAFDGGNDRQRQHHRSRQKIGASEKVLLTEWAMLRVVRRRYPVARFFSRDFARGGRHVYVRLGNVACLGEG